MYVEPGGGSVWNCVRQPSPVYSGWGFDDGVNQGFREQDEGEVGLANT